ncbi:hypothetical protein BGZ95_007966 [Linnemannia exigua]|uniref:Uncharacterized protein n=1 Tax=Linnemannia exigua TaxID=604196 RepID=A0AAD4HBT8_9FUNG|nr:hypothetical protein BGZ95_007966 [Linnemannia exigua]
MCASANCNNSKFIAASASAATSPMSEPSSTTATTSKSSSHSSSHRQTTPKMSSLFVLAIVIFTSTLLAAITPTTDAIPIRSLDDSIKSNEPSTYGCPAQELCIEHCKTMGAEGYCGEFPQRSCFCTL